MASIFSKTYMQDLLDEAAVALKEACMETYMDKAEVRDIIEATLKSGIKRPGIFALPQIKVFKSKLESCSSTDDVVALLEENRTLLSKSHGLSDAVFDSCVANIKRVVMHQKPKKEPEPPPAEGSPKAPCSCGSGKRFENCHGR